MVTADFRRDLSRFRARAAAAAACLLAAEIAGVWTVALLLSAAILMIAPAPGLAAALLHTGLTVAAGLATAVAGFRYARSFLPGSLPARIEDRLPGSAGLITTAATLSRRGAEESRRLGVSEELGRAVTDASARLLSEAPGGILFARRDVVRRALLLGIPALLAAAVLVNDTGLTGRAAQMLLHPVGSWPSPVGGLRIVPARAVVLSGGALTVRAVAAGIGSDGADLVVRTPGIEARRIAMRRLSPGLFETRLADLRAPATYRAEAGGFVSNEGELAIEPVPGVADITVTVRPPAHTGLPERTSAGGAVQALRGSTVTVLARGVKPLASGEIVFADRTARPLTVDGARIRASWIASSSGWYRFSVTDLLGNESPPGLDYPVTVTEDRPPVVLIERPATDIELDDAEPVAVSGTATDDFGITGFSVRYRLPDGEERTVPLAVPRRGGTEVGGEAAVDLPALPLSPGDRLTLWLEARDNDAVSGPKVASSRQIVVLLRDPAMQRKAIEEAEKRVAEELLNALADGLEEGARLAPEGDVPTSRPPDPGAFADTLLERMERASADIGAMADAVARNPRTPLNDLEEMDALADQVRRIGEQARGMPRGETPPGSAARQEATDRVEEMTRALEQAANLVDQMPRRRNLRDAVEKGENLAGAQNRLLDALQKMEERPSAEADRAVRDALRKIEDLLSQLGEILSKAPESLPEEFVNRDAMREFDLGSLASELAEIASLAKQGRAAEARAKAEGLAKRLAKLLASLKEGKEQMDRMGPEDLVGEMREQEDLLSTMITEQRAILDETQEIQNRVTRDMPAEAKRRVEETLPELEKTAGELSQALERLRKDLEGKPLLRSSVGEVAKNLDAMSRKLKDDLKAGRPVDFPATAEEIERGVADLEALSSGETSPETIERERQAAKRSLEEAAKAGREFRRAMRKLSIDPKGMVTPSEKDRLAGLSRREEALRKQAAGISARLDRLAALVPTIDPDAVDGMRQATREMGKAVPALGDGDPLGATPPERAALTGLQKGRSGLQASAGRMRRMARMAGVQMGDGGGRNPGGMFPALRIGMKPSTGKEDGGRMGVSTREFAIPKADEFVPQPGLRESLQRARGGNVPPAFREQVEEYYDRLSNR